MIPDNMQVFRLPFSQRVPLRTEVFYQDNVFCHIMSTEMQGRELERYIHTLVFLAFHSRWYPKYFLCLPNFLRAILFVNSWRDNMYFVMAHISHFFDPVLLNSFLDLSASTLMELPDGQQSQATQCHGCCLGARQNGRTRLVVFFAGVVAGIAPILS